MVAVLALCTISYIVEYTYRLHYISSYKLLIINSKLTNQLQGLENSLSTAIADLDSPLEKAIMSVKVLLASDSISSSQVRILHSILEFLNSSHLMTPDLYGQVKCGKVVMDKEQEVFVYLI